RAGGVAVDPEAGHEADRDEQEAHDVGRVAVERGGQAADDAVEARRRRRAPLLLRGRALGPGAGSLSGGHSGNNGTSSPTSNTGTSGSLGRSPPSAGVWVDGLARRLGHPGAGEPARGRTGPPTLAPGS